jgi:carbon-monoxide dehydrogenase medium subunit
MEDTQTTAASSQSGACVWPIDADTTLQAMLETEACTPLLHQALTGALSWHVRNRRPLRRALVSPGIAPQWMAALLALGATVTVEREPEPEEMPLEELLQERVDGEIIALHVRTEGLRWGYAQVARTPADDPIVAAVACVEMQGGKVRQARVALTGAWSRPVRLATAPGRLVGGPLDEKQIQAVATAVEEEVSPKEDFRGSSEYRRAMAGVMTRRALEQCLQDCLQEEV